MDTDREKSGPVECSQDDSIGRRTSFSRRIVDWFFGFDFFISYSHADGREYAAHLARELSDLGFQIFLDANVNSVGEDLTAETIRRVKMSQHMIVLAAPAALKSGWVLREVELLQSNGRIPIIVNINQALENSKGSKLAELALESHWLRIDETVSDDLLQPSDNTLEKLERAFTSRRQDSRRANAFKMAAIAAMMIISLAVFGLWNAEQNRQSQEAQASNALAAQAENELNNRRYESGAILSLSATAPRRDKLTPDWQRHVLSNAASNYFARKVEVDNTIDGSVRSVAFSPDNSVLAIGTNTGPILLYDMQAESVVGQLTGHVSYVESLAFAPGGLILASGSADGTLRLWSWRTREAIPPALEHDGRMVSAILFTHDGSEIISGGYDNSIRIWDTKTLKLKRTYEDFPARSLRGGPNAINAISLSSNERFLAVASQNNTFELLEFETGNKTKLFQEFEARRRFGGNWDQVLDLVILQDGQTAITASYDGIVRRWDISSGEELQPSLTPAGSSSLNGYAVNTLVVTKDGQHLALGSDNGDVIIRKIDSGKVVVRLFGHVLPINDLAISNDGQYLASASMDGYVWIWDLTAISKPQLVARFCDQLDHYGIDVAQKRDELIAQVSEASDIQLPLICNDEHREIDFEPVFQIGE
ncbi:MAG: TIR domain-containing protein [Hyphomicrobiales bacterium]